MTRESFDLAVVSAVCLSVACWSKLTFNVFDETDVDVEVHESSASPSSSALTPAAPTAPSGRGCLAGEPRPSTPRAAAPATTASAASPSAGRWGVVAVCLRWRRVVPRILGVIGAGWRGWSGTGDRVPQIVAGPPRVVLDPPVKESAFQIPVIRVVQSAKHDTKLNFHSLNCSCDEKFGYLYY